MNMKRKTILAIGLLCAMGAFAQDFPAYLKMEGTVITGCDIDALPANLAIPDGVTEIGESAFEDCTSLKSVSIPESVKKIGSVAFCGCKSLESVSIPDGVTKIGDYAFVGCESLKNVTIPASVKSIEEGAFEDYEKLTVRYNGTLAQWCEMDNDTFLVPYAKKIAMSDVANLKTKVALVIPEGTAKIGYYAFAGCESLKSVAISEGVMAIGSEAFVECESLKSVDIPASVTRIGYCAFGNCKSLKSVTIPAGVTEIGWNAFDACELLKEVKYLGTIAQWQAFNVRLNHGTVVRCSDGECFGR
ncbi:MAG: leucine-rich repeat domain-containing protein [Treponemataceae bacterium]|nr:leucine-rich repeat domain-containing protein [Treponemataceae bacterium]